MARIEAERKFIKKGRGRTKQKPLDVVANASLSNLDIANRNRGILKEAQEMLDLGRLIGANTIGNEEEIVKDIARIIVAREKKQ
ncbi:hypothetical protein V6N13_148832 [Hibiscus sabdariffa]